MKQLIPFLALLVGVSNAFAQGTVIFANHQSDFPTPADRDVYCVFVPLVGTNFQARLLYGTDATSLQPATYTTPARFFNVTTGASLAGTWRPSTRTLTGFNPGQTVTLLVQVWEAGPDRPGGLPGRTFDEALAGGFPVLHSAPFTYMVPPVGTLTPTSFYMDNFRGFSTLSAPCVPEPSSIAFVIIGGLTSLVAMRRRR